MRCLRYLCWAAAIGAGAIIADTPVRASTASDRAAAIVAFPEITIDASQGIDTLVELTNTSTEPIGVTCFHRNLRTNLGCLNVAKFLIRLTPGQPIAWRASQGRTTFPLDGITATGSDGSSNAGSQIPPLADPFTGTLECIVVDADGTPVGRNALIGQATLEQYQISPAPFLDATQYNAIGIPANQDVVARPDGRLVLGAEYSACPQVLTLSHFFDGAVEPAAKTSSVMTTLVLMQCSQDLVYETLQPVAVEYRVFNELEQQLGTAHSLTGCDQAVPLSSLDTSNPARSLFSAAVMGTLTGQTRVFTRDGDGGVIAVAVEAHHDLTDPGRVRHAAFNVHTSGTRMTSDTIVFAASTVSPSVTPTPNTTPTPTPTRTITATIPAEPRITFFGVTRADGTLVASLDNTAEGIPIYQRTGDFGFSLVIEGAPGATGSGVGTSSFSSDVNLLPDLQIEVSRPLGDGSAAVCDDSDSDFGGVPAISPFDFSPAQAPAINDLACRFKDGQNHPVGRQRSDDACTRFLPEAEYHFVDPASTVQFCGAIDDPLSFPSGDTLVAARLRDMSGKVSTVAQIVVRIAPPAGTPTRTRTVTRTRTATATPSGPPHASPTPSAVVTATPSATAPAGPQITFFGVTRADDVVVDPSGDTAEGVPIYPRLAASGFSLVVEGRPGTSKAALGTSSFSSNDVNQLPDLQIEVSRPLGDGSAAVCDDSDPDFGGVPAVSPFDFSPAEAPAINDLACRFKDGQGQPVGRRDYPCTRFLPELEYHFVDPASTVQFCGVIDKPFSFPSGDTMVAARIRDVAGNLSTVAQLVIRVATPVFSLTATPTATPSPAPTSTGTVPAAPPTTNFPGGDGCALASPRYGIWNGAIFGLLPPVLVCSRRRRERRHPPSS
jgi:hypothetical protein